MNDLYLIGNGFDLAHGLNTSYNDFLLWYLKRFLEEYRIKGHLEQYKDDLMKIDCSGRKYRIPDDFSSVRELNEWLKENGYKRKAHHDFFESIIGNYGYSRWVDIEYEYYSTLVKLYKEIELNPQQKDSVLRRVTNLNRYFYLIKVNLIKYLQMIDIGADKHIERINNILIEGTGRDGDGKGNKLYVYFNYTSTIDMYTKDKFKGLHDYTVYIHGKLSDEKEHIIFGYGDEIDPHYEKIENLNANEFLDNIKSFHYLKKDDYQYVIRFLEEDEFCVKVLGHSCGLSDRILLSSIFEHSNCKAIKIYYYQKSEKENDYFEKTQEISRHFKASMKGEMRMRIVPFEDSEPLIPFEEQN